VLIRIGADAPKAAPPGERAQKVFDSLKARGVLVKNVSKMHPLLTDCLRLTVGTASENQQLLSALQESL
jgi:histidinol-phosphate aminotransferase